MNHQDDRLKDDASPDSLSEADLVARLQLGDSEAFRVLVDGYAELLLRIATRFTASRSDAEDVVQETFEGALASLGRFEGRSSLKSWLISILRRRAARHYRKHKHIQFVQSDDPQSRIDAERNVTGSAESALDVETILASLSAEHREVVVLREIEGMTYEEIADALDIPRGTVESRLFRARQALRTDFEEFVRSTPSSKRHEQSGGDSQ